MIYSQSQQYKKFRVNIETKTLLDDFAPVLIDDISKKFEPIRQLKEEYSQKAQKHARNLQNYQEYRNISVTLQNSAQQVQEDFKDCEENVNYFSLVFIGAVSAGKTSMICDLINLNPDQLNAQLSKCSNFAPAEDDVLIAGEVATTNIYEFLVESSHIRLVDVPGTGGIVHDNSTLAPFVNMADCVIFLSNATSDLSRDDYNFVLRHVAGVTNPIHFKPENASDKKALIIVNKWNTIIRDIDESKHQQIWRKKKDWILWGDGRKFEGLSKLFKRTLVIVPANTSQRILDETTGTYDKYGKMQLDEILQALREILLQEGLQIKLERPKLILKHTISSVYEMLANERTKRSFDDLIEKLGSLGVKISVNSHQVMSLIDNRLSSLESQISRDLFYQVKNAFDKWKPSIFVIDRIKGMYPKWLPGSDIFGAEAVQEELKIRWQEEIKTLLQENIDSSRIQRLVQNETESISKVIEASFKAQLAELQQKMAEQISKGLPTITFGESDFDPTESTEALKLAIDEAVEQIKHSIVDDILGILTFDAIIMLLLGAFLTPLGSAIFFAARRWISGQDEERKAKQELEEAIQKIADEIAGDLRSKVAKKLRKIVQTSVNDFTSLLQDEQQALSKPLTALDDAIADVNGILDRLDNLTVK